MPSTHTEPPLVLVADDQSEARRFVRLSLEFENCRIVEAANGRDALAVAALQRPSAVILDILMPGPLDGYEVCRRIKADPALARTGVIIVSALDDGDSRRRGLDAGADAFLTKPLSFIDLVRALDGFIAPGSRAMA